MLHLTLVVRANIGKLRNKTTYLGAAKNNWKWLKCALQHFLHLSAGGPCGAPFVCSAVGGGICRSLTLQQSSLCHVAA